MGEGGYSAFEQGVMGTISFMALYALYFDIFWWYLSHISLLWRRRKPNDVEKTKYMGQASRPSEGQKYQILRCKYFEISPQSPYVCHSSNLCPLNKPYHGHLKQLEFGCAKAYRRPKVAQKWPFLALLMVILKCEYLKKITH